MPELNQDYINALFEMVFSTINNAQITFTNDFLIEVKRMKLDGMSDEAIFEKIKTDFFTDEGKIQTLLNKSAYELYLAGKSVAQNTVWAELSQDKYYWQGEPGHKHCLTCKDRDGKTYPLQYWIDNGLPGGIGTLCSYRCCCDLIKKK